MTLQEGPDLDRAVAKAIGLKRSDRRVELFVDPRQGKDAPLIEFIPSIDLNDAFRAGDYAGLFDVVRDGPEVHLAKTIDGQWEILTGATGYIGAGICGEMGYLTRESTPALAICAAILKLASR